MSPILEGWRAWLGRVGGFFVAGIVGGELTMQTITVTNRIQLSEGDRLPLAVGLAVAVVLVVTPLWWLLCRNGRTGPAWGALVGASAPVLLTASLAVAAIALGMQPVRETLYSAALVQLLLVPVTLVLAIAGGLLESRRSPVASE